jgi:poly(3-hydroxybutyrate) depolymerase
MKPRSLTLAVVCLLGAAAAAQQPAAPGRGRGPQPVDPRVQIRMHHFAETNEDIPYALFVSSKVRKDKKAPMIVTLHGIGGTHTTMMRPNAIDLAEAGGYILLAPTWSVSTRFAERPE